MTEPQQPDPRPQLEPSDSPSAALEAELGTLTDDEFFEAVDQGVPLGRTDDGQVVDTTEDIADLRHLSPAARRQQIDMLDEQGR